MAIKNRFSKKQKNYKSYVVNSAMDDNSAPQS